MEAWAAGVVAAVATGVCVGGIGIRRSVGIVVV
jgi:hypothetical protein